MGMLKDIVRGMLETGGQSEERWRGGDLEGSRRK